MKVLFVLRHVLYLRHYESTVRALAKGGHQVHLAIVLERALEDRDEAQTKDILESLPGVTFEIIPRRDDVWAPLLHDARSAQNVLMYSQPAFRSAQLLRLRMARAATVPARRWLHRWGRSERASARLASILRLVEKCIPADPAIVRRLRACAPDLVFVSPYVDSPNEQADYVKAAKRLRIPSAYGAASWDNLTTKGVLHVMPDRVLVWNEAQKKEAVKLHGVKPERVIVTGAPGFDNWIGRSPSVSRDEFFRAHHFDPAARVVTFVGSSAFISRDETHFVGRWIEAIRNAPDSTLRSANILVRPHPTNARTWSEADVSRWPRVTVSPREGELPFPEEAKRNYFDALYHSDVVVGVNSSALIDAGMLGKRSFTVLDREFADTQEGTLHFKHLTRDRYLATAADLNEHVAQLADELSNLGQHAAVIQKFVGDFIRPHGLDQAATPHVVAALVQTAKVKVDRAEALPWWQPLGSLFLAPWALWRYAQDRRKRVAGKVKLSKGRVKKKANEKALKVARDARQSAEAKPPKQPKQAPIPAPHLEKLQNRADSAEPLRKSSGAQPTSAGQVGPSPDQADTTRERLGTKFAKRS